ncbi:response regulator transcription factor [Kitasatospora sp. McL0602]|uniref:response regulator transcription factor n=1 Tax=Kitasatospora sp. McL0602 TaxID=3439530 RepID=UPI003F899891
MDITSGRTAEQRTAKGSCCGLFRLGSPVPAQLWKLTEREREVILLLGGAASNLRIAHRLGIGERTAKKHVSNILEKLGVGSRLEAALLAVDHHDLLCGGWCPSGNPP